MTTERAERVLAVLTESLPDPARGREFFLLIARLGKQANLSVGLIQKIVFPIARRMLGMGWPMSTRTAKTAIRLARKIEFQCSNATSSVDEARILADAVPSFRP